jgi:hypothetical protein
LFDFRDEEESSPKLPPENCPICHGKVIFYCGVCWWALLAIPRQDIPMCGNCYARLRQDETLAGEKRAVRKYLFQAALQKNKMLDEADHGKGIELTRDSQACLLVLDLYCKERKPDTYMKVQPPPIRVAIPSAVRGVPPSTKFGRYSSKRRLPKGRRFPSHAARRRQSKEIGRFLEALCMKTPQIATNS